MVKIAVCADAIYEECCLEHENFKIHNVKYSVTSDTRSQNASKSACVLQ